VTSPGDDHDREVAPPQLREKFQHRLKVTERVGRVQRRVRCPGNDSLADEVNSARQAIGTDPASDSAMRSSPITSDAPDQR